MADNRSLTLNGVAVAPTAPGQYDEEASTLLFMGVYPRTVRATVAADAEAPEQDILLYRYETNSTPDGELFSIRYRSDNGDVRLTVWND